MEAIKSRGFMPCYEAGFAAITAQGPDFGVSMDIDGFDPTCAPGTGMHEPGGIDPADIMPRVKGLAHNPHCVGIEIAEINLHNDEDGKTVKVIQALLEKVREA
jgi:arginase family enzyme